jgi:hypothetical protein
LIEVEVLVLEYKEFGEVSDGKSFILPLSQEKNLKKVSEKTFSLKNQCKGYG